MDVEAHDDFAISYYDKCIPSFAGEELDRLYGNRHACLTYFLSDKPSSRISTYTCQKNGCFTSILLFVQNKRKLEVLNRTMHVPDDEIRRFSEYMFDKMPKITQISFRAVETNAQNLYYHSRSLELYEDMILYAPASVEEYQANLGKNTRYNMRRNMNRLARDFPTFSFRALGEQEITEEKLRRLLKFSRERLSEKSIIGDDEAKFQLVLQMVERYGFVTEAQINGKICGGLVFYKINGNYFFRMIAHDPKYDRYSLGFVLCYLSFSEVIRQGGRMLNLGWDKYEYKTRLGGVSRKLFDVTIYRSYFYLMLDIPPVLNLKVRKFKDSVLAFASNKQGLVANFTHSIILYRRRAMYQAQLSKVKYRK